ncbi:uncharacterized protein LOC114299268 [Camellia sinensis]|uniref:uncharacterized protein LOC114299268 n=1 Tax=Camellia sinensis TaxID=4442 RepID=UPI00103646A8|nr:uncharacterized protein LOC114299268 [Camellia sinensis]
MARKKNTERMAARKKAEAAHSEPTVIETFIPVIEETTQVAAAEAEKDVEQVIEERLVPEEQGKKRSGEGEAGAEISPTSKRPRLEESDVGAPFIVRPKIKDTPISSDALAIEDPAMALSLAALISLPADTAAFRAVPDVMATVDRIADLGRCLHDTLGRIDHLQTEADAQKNRAEFEVMRAAMESARAEAEAERARSAEQLRSDAESRVNASEESLKLAKEALAEVKVELEELKAAKEKADSEASAAFEAGKSAAYTEYPPKDFRKNFYPRKDFKKLLDLPVNQRKAPVLLNFIPTYKSTLPDVPKKSKSSHSATTPATTSSPRPDQGSTSDPTERSSMPTPSGCRPLPSRRSWSKKAQDEAANSLKSLNRAEGKMMALMDQANAAKKAQDEAEEKVGATKAILKVFEAEKKEAEAKMIKAQKELQDALATKEVEIKVTDEKAYTKGAADVKEDYKKQVRHACNKGYTLGWMVALKELAVNEAEFEEEAEAEKSEKTVDDEEDEVSKDATPEKTTSDAPIAEKSLDQTLKEIDAELAAEKAIEKSSQVSSGAETQPATVDDVV